MNIKNDREYESASIFDFKEFFPEEEYIITQFDIETEDGYFLGLQRLQNRRGRAYVSLPNIFKN